VFIQGESGTGKELSQHGLALQQARYAVHRPDCASLSESLIESEIFGHEKGPSPAPTVKHGLVEVADTGTLFLDEIGEMPIGLQAKLLRFLDSGEFRRVAGTRP